MQQSTSFPFSNLHHDIEDQPYATVVIQDQSESVKLRSCYQNVWKSTILRFATRKYWTNDNGGTIINQAQPNLNQEYILSLRGWFCWNRTSQIVVLWSKVLKKIEFWYLQHVKWPILVITMQQTTPIPFNILYHDTLHLPYATVVVQDHSEALKLWS